MDQYDSLVQKKEAILMQYQGCYDLEVAMLLADLTPNEKQVILRDELFMVRVNFVDAQLRKKLIGTLVDNLDSDDERVAHKAAMDLGNVIWTDKFKGKPEQAAQTVPDSIVLEGVD